MIRGRGVILVGLLALPLLAQEPPRAIRRTVPITRSILHGFAAATREVSLAADADLNVVLEAAAAAAPTPKKRGSGRTQPKPDHDEPAKL